MNSRYDIYAKIIVEVMPKILTQLILSEFFQYIIVCEIHLFNFVSHVFRIFPIHRTPQIRCLFKDFVNKFPFLPTSMRYLTRRLPSHYLECVALICVANKKLSKQIQT